MLIVLLQAHRFSLYCCHFSCPKYRVPASTLATHPLVAASLAGLDSEETFDAAVDGTQPL